MKTLQIYIFLIATALFCSNNLQGQNYSDLEMIRKIYDALEDKSQTSNDLAALTPNLNWDGLINQKQVDGRYNITFPAVMQKRWGRVLFDRLNFQEVEKNRVLVTGIVKGRQPTECEFVSTQFQHTWLLNEGKIVNFLE